MVAKTKEDHLRVKGYCKEVAALLGEDLSAEAVAEWEEKVEEAMTKSSSMKLLKQACS